MAALKIATVCMVLLCVGSDLARPAVCLASSNDDQEAAASPVLLRELTQKLSLLAEQQGGVGDICPQQCQICMILCSIKCVFNPNPATCYANCLVTDGCFNKTMTVA